MRTAPITPDLIKSMVELCNYLADEESHFESCEPEEQANHIWKHREVVADFLNDTAAINAIG